MKQNVNRILSLLVALLLCVGLLPTRASADETSGSCGQNLNWSYADGVLTITGSGDMYDFPESDMAPWYAYAPEITAISLPDGLTRVGDLAFYGCTALTAVTLPETVKQIGWYAFAGCTAMVMLDLGGKVQIIEDGAFKECVSLSALRLPGTLTSIGYQAFYRCESITEVDVPASVTFMDSAVFAFCYQLVRADIRAEITQLPTWTFYGCSKLTELTLPYMLKEVDEMALYDCTGLELVSYGGTSADEIAQDMQELSPAITQDALETGTSNATMQENADGSFTVESTTTVSTENANISVNATEHYDQTTQNTTMLEETVDITIENSNGWAEILPEITDRLSQSPSLQVNIYTKDNSPLPADVAQALAQLNASVTVYSASGAVWKAQADALQNVPEEGCTFGYERTTATVNQLKLLGCNAGFQITFHESAQINAQVKIQLPTAYARHTASLYQVEKKEAILLQSVTVDDAGYACFYLAAVDKDTEYLIGIDVPGVAEESVIVPESLHDDYGITETGSIEYVITGVESSWGLTFGQVTLIMIGALVGCVVVIGAVMFALNKRKLKRGYVPDLDDED